MKTGKKIKVLVSPLDWGLGHATRCIPVIKALLSENAEVIVAGSGNSLLLLQKEFPQIKTTELRGFSPQYSRKQSLMGTMISQIPAFLWSVWHEHSQLRKIIKSNSISVVISDNRYGLWNKRSTNILITHQVFVKAPDRWKWLSPALELISRFFISFFDYCWIPDFRDNHGLSGELSHLKPLPPKYLFIGPLTRFAGTTYTPGPQSELLAIISGPESQRSVFENLIISQLSEMDLEATVVCGRATLTPTLESKGKLKVISYADSDTLKQLIGSASLVICRSGYSTIMDLAAMGKKALFVPTPGQTEQEYLANYLMVKGIALGINQNEMNLKEQLPEAGKYSGFEISAGCPTLQDQIELLLANSL